MCVRWYLRFKLSLRDLVELIAERGLLPRLGFAAHGVGLCGITDLDGRVVLAGEQDEFWRRQRGR